jgi:hypothetical protein
MSELERPIEKLLRASAEERRRQAGGPFELHPATRRLLQGEVARQYRHPAPATAPQRQWFQFWPRLAWSLGTFLVLGMAAFITWQSHQSAREDQMSVADRSVTNANQSAKNEAVIASAPTPFAPTAEAPTAKPTATRRHSAANRAGPDEIRLPDIGVRSDQNENNGQGSRPDGCIRPPIRCHSAISRFVWPKTPGHKIGTIHTLRRGGSSCHRSNDGNLWRA